MSRIAPLDIDQLPAAQQEALRGAESLMGFLPNDGLIMARNPALMASFSSLVQAVYAPGHVDAGLKRLIGLLSSSAAGCTYCVGHTAFASSRHGVDREKLADVWTFESSDHFDESEKAALRVALHAGQSPNAVTDAMFDALREHFDSDALLEIVAVIALFGFLNRWNSTLQTDLEGLPQAAIDRLSAHSGESGNHG